MSLHQILKDKRIERKNVADAAGAMLTKAHAENKRSLTPEERTQWEARMADVDRLAGDIGQLERQADVEQRSGGLPNDPRQAGREDITPGNPGGGGEPTDAQRRTEEKRSFRAWMQYGPAGLTAEQIGVVHQRNVIFDGGLPDLEKRALSAAAGGGALGAYTVPVDAPYALEIALKSYGGIVGAADYIDTDNGALLPYPTMNDTGNVGETIAESQVVMGADGGAAEQDPAFGIINFNAYMRDSGTVRVPIQLMQDSAFDPESRISEAFRIGF